MTDNTMAASYMRTSRSRRKPSQFWGKDCKTSTQLGNIDPLKHPKMDKYRE